MHTSTLKIQYLFWCSLIAASLAYGQTTCYVSSSLAEYQSTTGFENRSAWNSSTDLPTGTFTITPDTVPINGGRVTLTWTSQNADSAKIDNGIGIVALNGSIAKWVYYTTAFKLTLTGPNGSTSYIDSVFSLKPTTGTFTVTPDMLPINGGIVTLQWTSLNATFAKIDNGIGTVQPNGSITATVKTNTVFTLTLTGPAGSITYVDSVIVAKQPTGTFTITPDTLLISPGTALLQWTSENAIYAEIEPMIGRLDATSGSKTVTITTNTVFNLILTGLFGLTTNYSDSVIVLGPPTGTFTITPDTLPINGGVVTLQWTSQNATSAQIDNNIGFVAISGSRDVSITTTTEFKLTLTGPLGSITYVDSVNVLGSIVGIKSISKTPMDYALNQNYPNPFNTSTLIEYELPRPGFTTLKIYNALGVQISSLVSRYSQPGRYSVEWDVPMCASGMYFYRLQTGAFTATKKMILLK
jgi:hypothetical protein